MNQDHTPLEDAWKLDLREVSRKALLARKAKTDREIAESMVLTPLAEPLAVPTEDLIVERDTLQ